MGAIKVTVSKYNEVVSETGDAKLFNSYADVTDMEVGLSVDSDNVSTHIGLGLKKWFLPREEM